VIGFGIVPIFRLLTHNNGMNLMILATSSKRGRNCAKFSNSPMTHPLCQSIHLACRIRSRPIYRCRLLEEHGFVERFANQEATSSCRNAWKNLRLQYLFQTIRKYEAGHKWP
jgi:hypothetical protein